MSTRGDVLAEITLLNKQLVARYLAGFNDVTHVRQTPDLPNHVAWNLGHMALTMHRVAEKLDGKPLPTEDFIAADGFAGSRDKGLIDVESVSFGSKPFERHDKFPSLARCTQTFNNACDRLAAAVRDSDDAKLDTMIPWGPSTTPLWLLVARMTFHNGFHTGQISDLRRALGFRSVFA